MSARSTTRTWQPNLSHTCPRDGDGAIKPDVTVPCVGITSVSAGAASSNRRPARKPAEYLTVSGTSMAAHLAGAAVLKQKHPGWTYAGRRHHGGPLLFS
ncbi:S8 family serine peptidase [Streptomyces sp. NPDC002588]|uniref:S8 family serine peptidase n=1 Tax=Streptomyces sp. NPDC002588 TaxID=3154419 RepID=UPI00331EB2C4